MTNTRAYILSLILEQFKTRAAFDAEGLAKYRNLMSSNSKIFQKPKDIEIKYFSADSVKAAWIVPKGRKVHRCIMYTHGGGYIAGSIHSHTNLAARLSKAADAGVLLFNYRLAPEHPFPAGLDDVRTIYYWLRNHIETPESIALAGDSAGGGLNLALLSELLNQKKPLPECSVFFSPWIDLRCSNPSHKKLADKDPMLVPEDLKTVARLYTDRSLSDPMISPILNNFSGLSPVLIQVGENEVLLDDARMLDQKLNQAGVVSKLETWDGMFHVWQLFSRFLPEGVQALEAAGKFICSHTKTATSSINNLSDIT